MSTAQPGRPRPRDVAAVGTLWIPFLLVVASWLAWREALPDVLPRQWGLDGSVSSTSPTGATVVVLGAVCVLSALIGTLALRGAAAPSRRTVFLGTGFAAGLAGSIWLGIGAVTIAAAGAEPRMGPWVLLTIASGAYGVIPFLLAHKWVGEEPGQGPVQIDPVRIEPGSAEGRVWASTVTAPLFAWTALIVFAGAVALLVSAASDGPRGATLLAGLVTLVAVLVPLALVRLRITVDGRGLRIVSGILRVPVKSIPLRSIETVHTEVLEPLRWGGWGYRVMPGRSAIVLRTGPGMVVNLTNGRQFAITLDDPDTPAALLSALSGAAR